MSEIRKEEERYALAHGVPSQTDRISASTAGKAPSDD